MSGSFGSGTAVGGAVSSLPRTGTPDFDRSRIRISEKRKPTYSGSLAWRSPVIEWMPRSRGDNGWSHVREGYSRRPAVLEDVEGAPVVRVPVVVQNWVRAARRHAAYWLVLLARAAFFLAFAIVWSMRAATERFGPVWPVVVAGGLV